MRIVGVGMLDLIITEPSLELLRKRTFRLRARHFQPFLHRGRLAFASAVRTLLIVSEPIV